MSSSQVLSSVFKDYTSIKHLRTFTTKQNVKPFFYTYFYLQLRGAEDDHGRVRAGNVHLLRLREVGTVQEGAVHLRVPLPRGSGPAVG